MRVWNSLFSSPLTPPLTIDELDDEIDSVAYDEDAEYKRFPRVETLEGTSGAKELKRSRTVGNEVQNEKQVSRAEEIQRAERREDFKGKEARKAGTLERMPGAKERSRTFENEVKYAKPVSSAEEIQRADRRDDSNGKEARKAGTFEGTIGAKESQRSRTAGNEFEYAKPVSRAENSHRADRREDFKAYDEDAEYERWRQVGTLEGTFGTKESERSRTFENEVQYAKPVSRAEDSHRADRREDFKGKGARRAGTSTGTKESERSETFGNEFQYAKPASRVEDIRIADRRDDFKGKEARRAGTLEGTSGAKESERSETVGNEFQYAKPVSRAEDIHRADRRDDFKGKEARRAGTSGANELGRLRMAGNEFQYANPASRAEEIHRAERREDFKGEEARRAGTLDGASGANELGRSRTVGNEFQYAKPVSREEKIHRAERREDLRGKEAGEDERFPRAGTLEGTSGAKELGRLRMAGNEFQYAKAVSRAEEIQRAELGGRREEFKANEAVRAREVERAESGGTMERYFKAELGRERVEMEGRRVEEIQRADGIQKAQLGGKPEDEINANEARRADDGLGGMQIGVKIEMVQCGDFEAKEMQRTEKNDADKVQKLQWVEIGRIVNRIDMKMGEVQELEMEGKRNETEKWGSTFVQLNNERNTMRTSNDTRKTIRPEEIERMYVRDASWDSRNTIRPQAIERIDVRASSSRENRNTCRPEATPCVDARESPPEENRYTIRPEEIQRISPRSSTDLRKEVKTEEVLTDKQTEIKLRELLMQTYLNTIRSHLTFRDFKTIDANGHVKARDLAIGVFQSTPFTPSARMYALALIAHGRTHDAENCFAIFDQYLKLNFDATPLEKEAVLHSFVLVSCDFLQAPDLAMQSILEYVKTRQINDPKAIISAFPFNRVMRFYVRARDYDKVDEVYNTMKEYKVPIDTVTRALWARAFGMTEVGSQEIIENMGIADFLKPGYKIQPEWSSSTFFDSDTGNQVGKSRINFNYTFENSCKVDLHGLNLHEARVAVKCALDRITGKDLIIITGKGATLRSNVALFLRSKSVRHQIPPDGNKGRILIPSLELTHFRSRQQVNELKLMSKRAFWFRYIGLTLPTVAMLFAAPRWM